MPAPIPQPQAQFVPVPVASMVALRARAAQSATDRVTVLGFATTNDGGEGEFIWVPASTETPVAGMIEQVTGVVTGRWKRVFAGYINVAWFGAFGGGVLDETVPIRAAVAFAAGGALRFGRNKTYLFTRADDPLVVPANTIIDLNGSTISCPAFDNGVPGASTVDFFGDYCIFRVARVDNVEIRNGKVLGHQVTTGGNARSTYGVIIGDQIGAGDVENPAAPYVATTNVRLKDLDVSRFWWDGVIILGPTSNVLIEDCRLHHVRRNPLSVAAVQRLKVIRTELNHAGDATGDAAQDPQAGCDVETDVIGAGNTSLCSDVLFEDCYVHDNVQGIICQKGVTGGRPQNVIIRRAVVATHVLTGINVSTTDVVSVEGGLVSGITAPIVQGGGATGISVYNDCTKVTIVANAVRDCTRGIAAIAGLDTVIDGNVLVGRFDSRNIQTVVRSGNNVLATAHGFVMGQEVFVTSTGAVFGGITAGVSYYVRYIDANTFQLATTPENAIAGTIITLSAGESGTVKANAGGDNHDGIGLYHTTTATSNSARIVNNNVRGFQGAGIVVGPSSGVHVARNHSRDNGRYGIDVRGALRSLVENNIVSGNGREQDARYDDIFVYRGSDEIVVRNNRILWHDKFQSGVAAATTNEDQVTLSATTTNQYFNNGLLAGSLEEGHVAVPIEITAGTGAGLRSRINSYNGATRVALCDNFGGGAGVPASGSSYELRWQNRVAAGIRITEGVFGALVLDNDTRNGADIADNGSGTIIRRLEPAGNLVPSPGDLQTADWTPSGIATRTQDTLTENTSTSTHNLTGATSAAFVTGAPTRMVVEVKSTNRHAFVGLDATSFANVNASTGVVGTTSNCSAEAVVLPDGWVRLTIDFPAATNNNIILYMASADNTIVYLGTSATLSIRNISITQRAKSAYRHAELNRLYMNGRTLGRKTANVASASPLTLGDGNLFPITGTTTINYITTDGWTAGSVVTLSFSTSVTLTNAGGSPPGGTAPMVFTAGIDFSAVSGDRLQLIYDGTNWCQMR